MLGPGKRLCFWFQGCHARCPDCVSPHSWEFDETCRMTLEQVEQKIKFYALFTERLTISGGEPFAQPRFLKNLILSARKAGYKDVFVYSGQLYETLRADFPDVLEVIDVLVDGPFRRDLPTRLSWRGSENQRLIVCSKDPEIVKRYEGCETIEDERDSMQVVQSGKRAFVVGIPRPGKTIDPLRDG